MKRLAAAVLAILLILLVRASFTSALVAPPAGSWIAAPGLLAPARSGAASVRLYDGRVLVIGGYADGPSGPIASNVVSAFSPNGTFSTLAPMTIARAHHTATLLYDGTVLVTGGDTAAGTATATAELYNPFTDAWSVAAPMSEARSRHTATFLGDGRVLVAGGSSVEAYEPWSGTFAFEGPLVPARTGHAAALLSDGRVLLAGGTTADGPTAVIDAFQDGVGVTAIGSLSAPRTALSATTLLDGRVLFAGGRTVDGDVGTLETFDPATGTIALEAATLQQPRSGHLAFLLPDNNTVLIAGGTSADVPVASAEVFVPWTGQVGATGSMLRPRSDAIGAPLDPPGALVVAGGWNGSAYEAGAEAYGFATVRTDKADYAPGETVAISGNGWQPGETVTLVLKEVPAIDPDLTLTTVADASGTIANADFSTDAYDVGVRFYLTATGQVAQAENTFTDGKGTITGTVRSSASGHPVIPGATVTCSSGCNNPPVLATADSSGAYSMPVNFSGNSTTVHLTASAVGFSSAALDASVTNGQTSTGNDFSLTPTDTTPPTVSSITRDDATPTNASSVSWSVTFSEPVKGVGAGAFALAASGVTSASITSVSGSGTSYTVAAGTGAGTGTLGLNLVDDNSITDMAGNALGGPAAGDGNFSGPSYSIDRTAPTVTATPDRSSDHNGWYNHAVTITFSSPAADLDTCDSAVTYSGPDSSSAAVTGHCTDTLGNVGSATFSFKFQTSGPTATLQVTAGTAGLHGWYTSDVTLHTSGTDTVSGIESCTADQFQTAETIGATFNGSCTNNAGVITNATAVTVRLDKTGPIATLAVTAGTAGAHGWYVSDVTLQTSGSDTISAPVTCSDAQHQTEDTAGTVFNGSCTNDAGLTTNATAVTVKLDKTPPAVTATPGRVPDHDGWYNQALSVAFTATDTTSGVDGCAPDASYAGPDSATAMSSGTCTDNAGNIGTGTLTFEYDATAPAGVAASADRAPNGSGWYNSAVTFTFSGTDPASGIASCTTVSYSGPDTASATVSGTCTDHAGNTSASVNAALKYDATPPTGISVAADRQPDHNSWYNHPLTVTWSGTDATSGIASCTTTTYSTGDNASAALNGSCTDSAGNKAADVPFAFKYDSTGPTATLAVTGGTPGLNGWHTSDVTVTTSGSDTVSAPVTCTAPQTFSTETAGTTVTGSCTNDAGLTTNADSLTVKLDKTPPSAVLAVTAGTAGQHGWYIDDVTVQASGTDSMSAVTCTPQTQSLTTDSTGTTFNATCANAAGLSTAASPLVVKRDATRPVLSPSVTPNVVVLNGSATAAANATDATSGVDSATCNTVLTGTVGPQTVSCTAVDDAGNTQTATASYSVIYATSAAMCLGSPSHQVLQPINWNGSSVFNQKSTVPVKFRVCDANGVSIALAGVVRSFALTGIYQAGDLTELTADLVSTTPDVTFRWSTTDQLWIFNLSTKNLKPGYTYWYRVTLNDDSTLDLAFALK